MRLRDSLPGALSSAARSLAPSRADSLARSPEGLSSDYRALRSQLHRYLLDSIEPGQFARVSTEQLRDQFGAMVEDRMISLGVALNAVERRQMVHDVLDEVTGFGPLEPLLADPGVTDILVNSPQRVYVERGGRLERAEVSFDDSDHLMTLIERIVSQVGRRIDESSPMVDARLPDGSRVNAIIAPLALDGPCLSIRKFSREPLRMADLIARGALPPGMAELLDGMVRARLSLLISGGTGTGKTTLLNVLSAFIPADERIITIEDAAELQLQQPHVVRLETRPPNVEGRGAVTQRALVRNSLRMRPDRIILGEVRGEEAFDMLQAMNTGHEGSLATVHANSPRDALMRLENMVGMAELSLSARSIRQQVASAIDAVVQLARLPDGSRRITALSEVTGMEGETISMQDIFVLRQTGVDASGRVRGEFHATGVRPQFVERLKVRSIALGEELFDPRHRFPLSGSTR
jgi:pilus assembly protein CpaF